MKHLLSIVFIIILLSGCSKKTDDLFPEPSDERVAKALANYRSTLMDAPGWKLYVYPKGLESQNIEVGGLTYYVTFPDSNRTRMVSDFTLPMAITPAESGWRMKLLQMPSLIFDTYSYIHVAADPDENVSFSPTSAGGYGWGTDFEFGFNTVETSDTMRMVGNLNSSEAILIKVSQEEIDAAFGGRLAEIVNATGIYATDNAFLYFPASNNEKIGVSLNLFLYRINFNYLDAGGQIVTTSAPFSHTVDGLHFKDTVNVGGYSFQDAFWDDALEVYYINTANGRVNIVNSNEPLFPFASVLGRSITTVTVPTDPLPGQSPVFADVYDEVADNLINSPYGLRMDVMSYVFDDESKLMALNVDVYQGNNRFVVQYIFTYTFDVNGFADFTFVDYNGNGGLVIDEMSPLLLYLDQDDFKLDYFQAGAQILGQFESQQSPDFFFTGTLQ